MSRKSQRPRSAPQPSQAWPVALAAVLFFTVLSMLPSILPVLHLELHPTAPRTSYGVALMVAPRTPHAVHLPAVAQPISPDQPPASLPAVNAAREAATVAAEDKRLRTVFHSAVRVYQPEVIPVRGSLPTLVLTAGQSGYTAQTLVQYGALVMLPNHAALLIDNVYVAANASLTLGDSALRTLYLDSGSGGFATIVGWNGNLAFSGTSSQPLTIMGWDRSTNSAAADQGYGRSYIREAGGRMTLSNVRVSALGFWSGRTGGVAWTGLTGKPSTGEATDSTFTADTYGAFVARGSGVTFRDDLFEFNQLDGLHVHRYSVNTRAISSSAVRNGGSGFIVSPASQGTLMENDIAEHNGGNGFFLNGRPLASGASASGGSVALGTGTAVEYSAALANQKIGILVEGGLRPVVKGNRVCGGVTAIEVKDGATQAVITGNTISCAPRSGISVGPSAPGTVLAGNAIDGARTAVLIRNSGPAQFDKNLVTNATVFGVSARGTTSSVSGVGNTISGSGFRAIDSRALAPVPSLYGTNLAGWTYHVKVTVLSYLQFHPLAAMWLGIATLLVLAFAWSKWRRLPPHPYPASTRWYPESTPAAMPAEVRPQQPEPVLSGYLTAQPQPQEPAQAWSAEPSRPATFGSKGSRASSAPAGRMFAAEAPASFGSWAPPPKQQPAPEPGELDEAEDMGQVPSFVSPPSRWENPPRPPWDTMPIPKLGTDQRHGNRFDFPPLFEGRFDPSSDGMSDSQDWEGSR